MDLHPLRLVCIGLALLLGLSPPAATDGGGSRFGEEVIQAREKLLQLRAGKDWLKQEQGRKLALPEPPPPGKTDDFPGLPETLKQILDNSGSLTQSQEKRLGALKELEQTVDEKVKEAREQWKQAMEDALLFLEKAAQEKARWDLGAGEELRLPGGRTSLAGHARSGPALQLAFWAWLLATASLAVTARQTRWERRAWWRACSPAVQRLCRWGALLLVLGWFGLLGWIGLSLYRAGQPLIGVAGSAAARREEVSRLNGEIQNLQRELASGRANEPQRRQEALIHWRDRLGLPAGSRLEKDEADTDTRIGKLLLQLTEGKYLAADRAEIIERDRANAAWLSEALNKRQGQPPPWGRMSLSVLMVAAAFLPPLGLAWRRRVRLHRQGQVCPRCGAQGQFEVHRSPTDDLRYPERKYVRCPQCRYRMLGSARYRPRLSFPTVGLPDSGKTLWALETHDLILSQGLPPGLPPGLALTQAPSLIDDPLKADRASLREVHRPRSTEATEGQFPPPIALQFQDRDRPASHLLLHLFDFPGAMAVRSVDASILRRRALLMDGFLFFLDPTQPTDRQQAVLHQFCADVRVERRIPDGQPIPLPLAVCLTKLDLLPSQTVFHDKAMEWLRELRTTAGTAAQPLTLRQFERRSLLARKALRIVFRGWKLEEELSRQFGRSFLFFPLTPVGLDERELLGPDVTDLSKRSFDTFGIREPILWLLHMQGYQVFQEGDR